MNDVSPLGNISISGKEFAQFQKLIFELAGICLSDAKKILLVGRLSKRLREVGCASFSDYFQRVNGGQDAQERQIMVDLLTTNETYFFRESKHFDFLRQRAAACRKGSLFRVWSAASSSGEEAYSAAMVLAETLGNGLWEILGTDISTKVLTKALGGVYSLERTDGIPPFLLKKYCLKGVREQAGTLLIAKELRDRVSFFQCNLMEPNKGLGQFDVIFLRNVMIYFDSATKRKVVANLVPYLKGDGHLLIGHSESLNGLTDDLVLESPTIYRRAGAR